MDKTPTFRWIAVDPGRSKCGYACFEGNTLIRRGIIPPEELAAWLREEQFSTVVVGDRTGAESFLQRVYPEQLPEGIAVYLVDEDCSSQEGRKRYLRSHRQGWRKLWPISLQSPQAPYDDYVAEVLAERYSSNCYSVRSWEGRKPANPKKG